MHHHSLSICIAAFLLAGCQPPPPPAPTIFGVPETQWNTLTQE